MRGTETIVVLTGAGISAESGIPTFRGQDGLWETEDGDAYRIEDVCTPEAFVRDPAQVHAFYDGRRRALEAVSPNPAHLALARLDREWPGELLIVTQNVDDLHERAGATRLIHMHGELRSAWCMACDARTPWADDLGHGPACPSCGAAGRLRPDIVWFGEIPYAMERIEATLARADLFVSIGTSGAVYPAAGFVAAAAAYGARTLELNLAPSTADAMFDEARAGPAGRLVPEWVDEVLTR